VKRIALHSALAALAAVMMAPLVFSLIASVTPLDQLLSADGSLLPETWEWGNYVDAWTRADFSRYFLNSVLVTTGVVVLDTVVSSMTGYVLARRALRGQRALERGALDELARDGQHPGEEQERGDPDVGPHAHADQAEQRVAGVAEEVDRRADDPDSLEDLVGRPADLAEEEREDDPDDRRRQDVWEEVQRPQDAAAADAAEERVGERERERHLDNEPAAGEQQRREHRVPPLRVTGDALVVVEAGERRVVEAVPVLEAVEHQPRDRQQGEHEVRDQRRQQHRVCGEILLPAPAPAARS
jgi:hypothetical protein